MQNPDLFQQFLQFQQFQQWANQQAQLNTNSVVQVAQPSQQRQTTVPAPSTPINQWAQARPHTPVRYVEAVLKLRPFRQMHTAPISVLQLPDALTKKSAILSPTARFLLCLFVLTNRFVLADPQKNPATVYAKVVLASDTHLDQTRSALKDSKFFFSKSISSAHPHFS